MTAENPERTEEKIQHVCLVQLIGWPRMSLAKCRINSRIKAEVEAEELEEVKQNPNPNPLLQSVATVKRQRKFTCCTTLINGFERKYFAVVRSALRSS